MTASFDHVALEYDTLFTHSEIGKRQRNIVYQFLESNLHRWHSIFEINCGTGEDAIFFAQKGKQITATDISKKMIETAQKKAAALALDGLQFEQLDSTRIKSYPTGKKYDLIFSNFGGLNCLNPEELKTFLSTAQKKILNSHGSIVMVLMSKGSIWESLFYLKKLDFKKAFRRMTNKALPVNVEGKQVATYYYNPSFFKPLLSTFHIQHIQTVGFFLPPSYLEDYFKRKPKLLSSLFWLENKLSKLSFLAGFSDHYLIELKAR